jgi:putative hydrolase of the HAD superfamily
VIARWGGLARADAEILARRFSFGPAYQAHERGEIDAARYFESLRKDLGIELDDAQLADGWQAVFGDEIAPTVALVKRLAPVIPQYLLSNTNATHYAHFGRRYATALAPLRRVFVSHEMRCRKPEPEAYAYVADAIGVPPDRILFLDDSAVNVEGARAVGMDAVLVKSHVDVSSAVQSRLGIPPLPS